MKCYFNRANKELTVHSTQVKQAKTLASLKINISEKYMPTITKINFKTRFMFFF